MLLDGFKLFSPGRKGEWRFLLLLFLFLFVLLIFLVFVFDLNFGVDALRVVLQHLEDFARFEVALHLTGEVLATLKVFILDVFLTGIFNAIVKNLDTFVRRAGNVGDLHLVAKVTLGNEPLVLLIDFIHEAIVNVYV